tara:strand:+ start:69 stop:1205 length:1137 start_codon:yes stop_codon:yes gene_type:complete
MQGITDMQFEKMVVKKKKMEFEVSGVDISIINSLRRTVLADLQNVGFYFNATEHSDNPSTIIEQNDTPLHNEFMMHRISMIPIHVSKEELEDWDNYGYMFEIDVVNKTGELKNVTSGDFVVYSKDGVMLPKSTASRLFPIDPITKDHILITKLNKNMDSKLIVKAMAIVSTAKSSVSFGLVSKCSFELVVDEKQASKALEKLLEEAEESKHHDIKGNFKNLNRDRHYRKNKYLEADLFKICIESECSIQSIDIYSIAIRHLKESFSNMMDKNYKIENNKSFMTIIIPVGSHTTGNMLQAICFNRLIRENIDNTFGLTYIGYNIPHPLEQTMLIKVKGDDLVTIDDTITLFRDMLKIVIEELEQFENQWIIFSSKYKKT